jgi:large subunit ribosomal protein L19
MTKNLLEFVESQYLKTVIPNIRIGDVVEINYLIPEGNKERVQRSEGIVIAKKHGGINTTITVRRTVENVGVEQIFLLHSPKLIKIEARQHSKVRRAKLYYLRNAKGKKARLKQKF